ncbi:hypothetical protein [Bradyrhizobium erythrophlei]|jgi:hypothetical protein|uniref:hypothetical protein n=1 Tax=Bradyrhizobium erythrophlei TaxID=1437360 RepID=UPI0009A81F31|nr:hypothetical protein [Bradyrhizobium erythrophlei]
MFETRPNTLTNEEFSALQQIGDARESRTIPTQIRERLLSMGYATDDFRGLIITDEGMLRIMTGK